MAIYFTNTASINLLQVTGSVTISSSISRPLLILIGSGSTLFSISGSTGEIFRVEDTGSSTSLFTIYSGSFPIFDIQNALTSSFSGSLRKNNQEVDTYLAVLTLGANVATGANVTPVDLTGITFNYEANALYTFEMFMMVSPNAATTGCGFAVSCSSAVSQSWVNFYHQLADTGTLSGGSSKTSLGLSEGVSSGMPSASAPNPVAGHGFLKTGATTGSCQFKFRSETTAVTTCMSGSTVIVKRLIPN